MHQRYIQQAQLGGTAKQHKGELTPLRQQQPQPYRTTEAQAIDQRQPNDDAGFNHQQRTYNGKYLHPVLFEHAHIQRHADRHEKQAHQNAAERVNIGIYLMAVFGAGKHQAA